MNGSLASDGPLAAMVAGATLVIVDLAGVGPTGSFGLFLFLVAAWAHIMLPDIEARGGDDRAQLDGTPGQMVLIIFGIIALVTILVGKTIMERFQQSIEAADGPVHFCGSAGGCTGIAPDWWIFAGVILSLLAASLVLRLKPSTQTEADTE